MSAFLDRCRANMNNRSFVCDQLSAEGENLTWIETLERCKAYERTLPYGVQKKRSKLMAELLTYQGLVQCYDFPQNIYPNDMVEILRLGYKRLLERDDYYLNQTLEQWEDMLRIYGYSEEVIASTIAGGLPAYPTHVIGGQDGLKRHLKAKKNAARLGVVCK